jgi:hypothetical protein
MSAIVEDAKNIVTNETKITVVKILVIVNYESKGDLAVAILFFPSKISKRKSSLAAGASSFFGVLSLSALCSLCSLSLLSVGGGVLFSLAGTMLIQNCGNCHKRRRIYGRTHRYIFRTQDP